MANYTFSVDGPESASIGIGIATVTNLDFFDTTDTVTAASNSALNFEIGGDLALDLTGYAGITGFAHLGLSVTGSIDLTIGQDFYDANNSPLLGGLQIGIQPSGGPVTIDASGISGAVIIASFGASNAVLTGGAGNDFLSGGAGDDQLNGGAAGADRIEGGDGFDTVHFDLATGGVTVNLALGTGTGSDGKADSYTSIEGLVGSGFADTLTGDGGANVLSGGAGVDVLAGGGGADRLDGGGRPMRWTAATASTPPATPIPRPGSRSTCHSAAAMAAMPKATR